MKEMRRTPGCAAAQRRTSSARRSPHTSMPSKVLLRSLAWLTKSRVAPGSRCSPSCSPMACAAAAGVGGQEEQQWAGRGGRQEWRCPPGDCPAGSPAVWPPHLPVVSHSIQAVYHDHEVLLLCSCRGGSELGGGRSYSGGGGGDGGGGRRSHGNLPGKPHGSEAVE